MTRLAFRLSLLAFAACAAFELPAAAAQTQTKPAEVAKLAEQAAPPPMTMKQAKEKLGIIVFPAKGQTPEQQEADELACLQWGAEQAGVTANSKPKDGDAAAAAAAQKVDSAAAGAAVKGAAKGAAVGAIFGSISGNADQGAAYGAVGGALAGRSAKKQAKSQAAAQAKAKTDAENQAKLDQVKKGMTLCLESKGYTVK